jgi:hypothetical protein
VAVVSKAAQALAFELGEPDAIGGVGDVEVKDGPDERLGIGASTPAGWMFVRRRLIRFGRPE